MKQIIKSNNFLFLKHSPSNRNDFSGWDFLTKINYDHIITFVMVLFVLMIFSAIQMLAQNTYTVTNTNNDGEGSLAQAITNANNNSGADTIEFNIPGDGPHILNLTSELPDITGPVSIMGYSQTGSAKATSNSTANLMIGLDGANTGQDAFGISITADNCTIEGLAIYSFGREGIYLGGSNCKIQGNYIGVSIDGSEAKGNGFRSSDEFYYDGLWIDNGSDNLIGGENPGDRNVISCNASTNIYMDGMSAKNNMIKGNFIGPDATGSIKFENQSDGIWIDENVSENIIGGTGEGAGNLISGNGYKGIYLGKNTSSITIQGNLIGTNADGTSELGNGEAGINLEGSINNLIGGNMQGAGNVISGNGFIIPAGGIGLLSGSENNTVQGNYVGTDAAGTNPVPNLIGIIINNSNNNLIGGSINSGGNLVSGNERDGVLININSEENVVKGNIIGMDKSGKKSIGNMWDGVELFIASSNIIGSKNINERNIISGNESNGCTIYRNESTDNKIIGNYIGLNIDGSDFIPNDYDGVAINGGLDNIIGGTLAGEGNVIAGNGRNGVLIKESSSLGKVQNEKINTNSNSPDNIKTNVKLRHHSGHNNSLLSSFSAAVNISQLSETASSVSSDSGNFNSVLSNSIYSNMNLGIDIVGVDRTNDDGDADEGANSGQNFPDIESVTGDGTEAAIQYSVNSSTSNSAYPLRVEFFIADENGQGKIYLGNDVYSESDAMNAKTFTFSPSVSIGENEKIVSTATDANGNTSEFSEPYTTTSVVGIDEIEDIPSSFSLQQNYPNPFNPTTTLKYSIPRLIGQANVASDFSLSKVALIVYDVLGRKVKTLVNENKQPGNYEVTFNASDLSSGIYYYTLKSGNFISTKKMILLK